MLLTRSHARRLLLLPLLSLPLAGCASLGFPVGDEGHEDTDRARAQLRATLRAQAAGREARSPAPELRVSAPGKLLEGDRYRRQGNLPRALLAYFEAARLAPEDSTARRRVAHLEIAVDPLRAERSFQKLLEREPEHPDLWLGLGLARLAQSQLEGAREALERALALDPESPSIRSTLGAVHDRLGGHELAQEQLRRALELEPDGITVLNNLAVSHLLTEQPEAAEELLRRAVRLEPGDPVVLNNLALAVGLQGRYDEALQIFRQTGDEQSAQNNLGYVYYLSGELPDAVASYERALLSRGEHDSTVLRNLEAAQTALERRAADPQRWDPEPPRASTSMP